MSAACLVFAAGVFAQTQSSDLETYNRMKVARLAGDVAEAQVSFVVDGGTKLMVHVRSLLPGVTVNINCPNGQTVNSGNVGNYNGSSETYEISEETGGLLPSPALSIGHHELFEFDIQGVGTYDIHFDAPPKLDQELPVIADVISDSTLKVKLLTSASTLVQGKPITFSLVLIDGQTPVTGADVSAEILLPDGTTAQTTLVDNGEAGDYQAEDGIYSSYYIPGQTGEYVITADVTGSMEKVAYDLTSTAKFFVNPFVGRLTGDINDFGVDEDADGLYEKIVVSSEVETTQTGEFGVFVHLKTPAGKDVVESASIQIDSIGTSRIEVPFKAETFRALEENGPFDIVLVELVKYTEESLINLDSLQNPGQTQAYQLNQWQRPAIIFTGNNEVVGIDLNGNGKFELLKIKVGIDVVKPLPYIFGGTLYDANDERIDTYNSSAILPAGPNQITLLFNGAIINQHGVSGVFKLRHVFVREYRDFDIDAFTGVAASVIDLMETEPFDIDQFESVYTPEVAFTGVNSHRGVDLNANGKFEYLETNTEIFVPELAYYDVKADLADANDNIILSFPFTQFTFFNGLNNLRLTFDGAAINASERDGPYKLINVSVRRGSATMTVPELLQMPGYTYNQFESDTSPSFTGNNEAVGVDRNENGKFDILRVRTEIFIRVPGLYKIEADLLDSQGAVIDTDSNLTISEIEFGIKHFYPAGFHMIELEYDGLAINGHDVDGPYVVGNVRVRGNDNLTGHVRSLDVAQLFTTGAFTVPQFESLATFVDYISYQLTPVTGDGDAFFEPGENAELLIKLGNSGDGTARHITASITTNSSDLEVLSAASNYPNIRSPEDGLNTTPFVVRLKPTAQRNADVSVNLTFDSDSEDPKTVPVVLQTGFLNKIVYVNRAAGRYQIYQMNSDGSSKVNLSNSGSDETNPTVSPDGTKIAYTTAGALVVMNADGANKLELDPSLAIVSRIAWSPDSTRIAYEKLTSGFNRDIFIIGASGGTPVQVTQTPNQSEIGVSWSPTAEKIAYLRGNSIYSANSDGTGVTLITTVDNTPVYSLAWSPDSNHIAWIEWPSYLYMASSSGGSKTLVDMQVPGEAGLSWSPDSTKIAYFKEGFGEGTGLGYAGIDGTPFFSLQSGATVTALAWSPNGQRITFADQEPLVMGGGVVKERVRVINIDGTGNTRLSNYVPATVSAADLTPRWRPLDVIPPTSGTSITPEANAQGWNTSNVTVGVTAVDNQYGSGVQNHTYGITGAQAANNVVVNSDSSTFTVFKEGVSTVTYFARDNAENVETGKTLAVKIDKTLPVSHHSLNVGSQDTTFTLTAADAVSGIDQISYSVDGGSSQTYTAPFAVSNTGGHIVKYFAKDIAGNEETPRTVNINPDLVANSVLISEFRARGYLGADDEFIELYNNGDASVDISGWTVNVKHGSNTTPVLLATIASGTVLPARGHYLLRKAGSSNYSLSGYAEADQTYTDALGDNCGIKLVSTSSTTIDAVGFASVTDSTYREGTGITPSAGITTSGQYSFARNFSVKNLPVDSNNSKNDFIFVSTDAATYNNLKSILGSPGPENLSSHVYKEGNILVGQVDDEVTLAESPNRFYNYSETDPVYPVGTISVRRRLFNNTGQTVSQMRLRVTAITTKNSAAIFPTQAVLRLLNTSDMTVMTADGEDEIQLKGLTVNGVPTTVNGGLNSSYLINLGPSGLAPGSAVNINLKAGIVTNGQYKLEFRFETVP